jgi:hypothetical protein
MTRQESAQQEIWELIEDIISDWAARDRQVGAYISKTLMTKLERLLDEASDWTDGGMSIVEVSSEKGA